MKDDRAYGQNEEVAVRILFLPPEFVIVCCFCMAESARMRAAADTTGCGTAGTEQVGMSG
jgi:hypothetical protein